MNVCENGKVVRAFLDTGSEATIVTERWVQENMQHANHLPLTKVTLKAGNGLEILHRGVIFVELKLLGQILQSVQVLVVKESSDPATRERKCQVPAVLGRIVLMKSVSVLSKLQPALLEAHLENTSARCVVRVASQSFIPARSLATIRFTGVGYRSRGAIFWHHC